MNALIIDDLSNIVEDIIAGVNWERLKIDRVFKAFGSVKAKEIIKNNPIDIMICDIEMPEENGLTLYEWVAQNYTGIECIFLTSFSEFDYAKKAITLGSFDYLLKPIKFDELENVIEKALIKIHIDRQTGANSEYWKENIAKVKEKFWFDLLKGVYKNDKNKIETVAKTCDIADVCTNSYRLILIHIIEHEILLGELDDDLIKNDITKVLTDLIGDDIKKRQIVQIESGMFILIEKWSNEETDYHLQSIMELFIQVCERDLKWSVDVYISGCAKIDMLPKTTNELIKKVDENVADYKRVFFLNPNYDIETNEFEIEQLARWETLLLQGFNAEVENSIIEFIKSLVKQGQLDRYIFEQMHSRLFKMLDKVFTEKHLDAYMIFHREDIALLYVESLRSVDKLVELIKLLLCDKFLEDDKSDKSEMSIDVIEKVKTYIYDNLEKELSRQELANRVFLNPEYLSRLFKKTTGISLTEFIKNERMNLSKHLLSKTNMPVSIIASKSGYSNFSHFSQVFKQHTSLTPIAYRQKNQ